ncbi:Uu.00g095900.m01.CDS01 [Anthostomella pinea]|uniref:Uu.00g095900.m01.CDS01 n=1 Tax=Anthostomella pinea TaxID=933095 RepID=A0AAI8VD42_9PEZI|nr:Uu.00g095900.m01.CDS01 [Anthostomella pinea]
MRSAVTLAVVWARAAQLTDAASVLAHFMVSNSYAYTAARWKTDIIAAQQVGIDGFALNWNPPDCESGTDWLPSRIDDAFAAAKPLGFKLVHSFDMSWSKCKIYWNETYMAGVISKHADSAAAYRWDNALLVTTYGGDAVNEYGNGFFENLKSAMGSTSIKLAPALTTYSSNAQRGDADAKSSASSLLSEYSSIDGFLNWQAWPLNVKKKTTAEVDKDFQSALRKAGKSGPYIMGNRLALEFKDLNDGKTADSWVAYSDYLFPQRFELLTGPDAVINPDIIELITWNDWAESHYIRDLPSTSDNSASAYVQLTDLERSYVDGMSHAPWRTLAHYYTSWWKNGGAAPSPTMDQVVFWHRVHPAAACSGVRNSDLPADAVFAWALVTNKANISVTVGSNQRTFEADPDGPAVGMAPFLADLGAGVTPEVVIMRDGRTVATGKSSHAITASLLYMFYHRIIATTALNLLSKPSITVTSAFQMSVPSSNPVIIVGSGLAGLAGLAGAHEALKAGVRVHMLERAPKPGGNSIKASSGINGAGTRFQHATDDSFTDDTLRSAGARLQAGPPGLARKELIQELTARSKGAVDWLVDEIGVDLSVVAQLGGHSVARTHRGRGNPPPGAAIVTALLKQFNENAGFTLSTSADVEALLTTGDAGGGAVGGVRYSADGQTHELQGPVVFAAGGFAGDAHGLLAKHRPDLEGMPSTNEAKPGSHALLAQVGAEFVDMECVQIHPTGFVDPKDAGAGYKFLAAEALRGEGGILLSSAGERFVNEMDRRDVVSEAIMALPRSGLDSVRQWGITLLLDPGACEATASHLSFYLWKGLMEKRKVKDLPPTVIASVDKYAETVASGSDAAFGRRTFGHWRLPAGEANREQEVCVGTVTPVIHFTMGGVAFNTATQVLRKKEDALAPIDGLWAAGEITGGIHGANRLGGSSLLECAVFGRIAGAEAARSVL